MAEFEHVRPGAVISSDLINRMMDKLIELEGLIGTGTGGTGTGTGTGPQVITELIPATQQAAGQPLTVKGNFDFPLNTNTITIGDRPIVFADLLAGSDSQNLIFNIPTSLAPVGAPSRPVTVRVRRANGQEGRRDGYLVLPEVVSTVPNPVISSVTNFDNTTPGALLQVGQRAAINGQNLLPNPTVEFRVQTAPGVFSRYPDPGPTIPPHPGPTIDFANSLATRLVVTVPNITENASGDIPVTVLVTIPGAANTASGGAMLMSA